VQKAWHKDRTVALLSPIWLGIRALGLGMGYGWGVLRPAQGISGQETTIGGLNYVGKRTLDIIGGVIGLLFTALCFPFIAISIKRSSPGKILFTQERVGQGGEPFTIYKFRSMIPNAEAELHALVDIETLAEPAFKLKNDPRIFPAGHTLRRWSLDELPQFWNVLKGDMSLIGPRPEEAKLVARYSDWHRRRLAVKPGISGPMQVNGRGNLPMDERVRLELDYIENYSLWRDIQFILQTLPAVWRGDGAR
jgi:lipopolysaccharide/colanic/teichoic acid biosynthesis glycosyltransferase